MDFRGSPARNTISVGIESTAYRAVMPGLASTSIDRPMSTTGRRVGRPRAQERPDSGLSAREELLSAAAELFTTRGYAATTTRAVAERAGMRQATMYHYVSGKEDRS